MVNFVYQIIAWACFLVISPFFVIYSLGGNTYEWRQRLGFYAGGPRPPLKNKRIWLHAASVGEVQVARALIPEIERQIPEAEIWVSTLTRHGHLFCRETMPTTVTSIFAPLDLAGICAHAMGDIAPDLYVCLETELWPEIIRQAELRRAGPLLLNARLSERSCRRYGKWPTAPLIRQTLSRFQAIAAIGEDDARRFLQLGADPDRIKTCGNAKYDLRLPDPLPADEAKRQARKLTEKLRQRLGLNLDQPVLVAGSTHTGEEEQLLAAWQRLKRNLPGLVLIIAPRHLRRLPEIEASFQQRGLLYWRYSDLERAMAAQDPTANRTADTEPVLQNKQSTLILVDRMGELISLYNLADYVFCGGSLVPKGGHNLLEAAVLGKPVLFGPHMDDFREDAELLLKGGGFRVRDDEDICQRIMAFHTRPAEYHRAAEQARDSALTLRGAVRKQVELIKEQLDRQRQTATTTAEPAS